MRMRHPGAVIIRDVWDGNDLELPDLYPEHSIISTVDVIIPATDAKAENGDHRPPHWRRRARLQ
jgi:hypothetical protein